MSEPKNLDRAKEMDKALLMAKLFREEFFEPITTMVYEVSTKKVKAADLEPKFIYFCEKAEIDAENAKWLWGYLSNYNPKNSGHPPLW
jgi:hypothetical protein